MKRPAFLSRRLALIAFVVTLLAGFTMVVARTGPLAPVQVTVAHVEMARVAPSLFGIGTVEARRGYFIGPIAAGRVRAVLVDVGERVEAGQLLAEIDPVDLDARIDSLAAGHARAQSAVVAAEAQHKEAQARQQLAALNARRYLDLGERRFVSTSAIEGKAQELVSARAAREVAEANLLGARQELARLRAEQDALRQQRRNLRLLAPHDGIVSSRDAEAGSTVVAGQSIVRLIEPDSLWIKVRLDQGRSRGLAVGLPAELVLRANPSLKLSGTVRRVEPLSDSVTEERIAYVGLAALPAGLTVGELAEVTVIVAPGPAMPTLPNAAIKHTPQGTGVWRLIDGKPDFARVATGERGLDGRVEIRGGLREGDTVIVHSARALSAGSRIKVVEQLVGSMP